MLRNEYRANSKESNVFKFLGKFPGITNIHQATNQVLYKNITILINTALIYSKTDGTMNVNVCMNDLISLISRGMSLPNRNDISPH